MLAKTGTLFGVLTGMDLKRSFLIVLLALGAFAAHGQKKRASRDGSARNYPELKRIYFDLYTDSIKPVLNYYVNVVGELKGGGYLPLDSSQIFLTCDRGQMNGNEWVLPKHLDFDKVTFTATARSNEMLRETVTVYIKKERDPRDEPGFGDEEQPRRR